MAPSEFHSTSAESEAKVREDARAIFLAALGAASPVEMVRKAVQTGRRGGVLIAGTELEGRNCLRLVAVGKAALSMAQAALEVLPQDCLTGRGVAIIPEENADYVEGVEILAAGHPIPDARGVEAALKVESYVSESHRGDGLLLLLSGGGSALLPAPAPGLSLEDKMQTTRLLLECGATIQQINTVRKHLSRLKGGRLAALAMPAAVEALIVSDVVGDDLSTIASGPTAPDPTTFQEALEVLEERGILEKVPSPVREHLESGQAGNVPETPKPKDSIFAAVTNRIIASNELSLETAAAKSRSLEYPPIVLSREVAGEARDAAQRFLESVGENTTSKSAPEDRVLHGPQAFLAAGETTVTVQGPGVGGRNQEFALAFALEAEKRGMGGRWSLLSAGTDGKDGPTDAAGAIVDGGTLMRGRNAGLDPERALACNDSYPFLEASGDLLKTGPTGTNVADLQILLVASK